jgi:hypothetical protein
MKIKDFRFYSQAVFSLTKIHLNRTISNQTNYEKKITFFGFYSARLSFFIFNFR